MVEPVKISEQDFQHTAAHFFAVRNSRCTALYMLIRICENTALDALKAFMLIRLAGDVLAGEIGIFQSFPREMHFFHIHVKEHGNVFFI